LAAAPNHDPEFWQVAGQPLAAYASIKAAMTATPRAAAVLVPIVDHPGAPSLLLTQRAGHLRKHAGQISFPGGGMEASDDNVLGAALRETQEEIGIDSSYVQPLGFLPDQIVLTGFRITPVVALVQPGFRLRVDTEEVAEVFEVPLEYLSHAENFRPTKRILSGMEVTLNDLHFEGRVIWGATAGMLQMLRAVLLAEP
jgi:8-oxo-dGTP pyrophosphatase MutT (NUDIX family)